MSFHPEIAQVFDALPLLGADVEGGAPGKRGVIGNGFGLQRLFARFVQLVEVGNDNLPDEFLGETDRLEPFHIFLVIAHLDGCPVEGWAGHADGSGVGRGGRGRESGFFTGGGNGRHRRGGCHGGLGHGGGGLAQVPVQNQEHEGRQREQVIGGGANCVD